MWRGGAGGARILFALLGLVVGGLILAIPFIPIFEKAFAFVLALGGWFYPDMVRLTHEYRHYKLLNRLVSAGEEFQRGRARYVSAADVEDDDEPVAEDAAKRDAAARALAANDPQRH